MHEHKTIKRIGIAILVVVAFFAGMGVTSYKTVEQLLSTEGEIDIVKVVDLYSKTRSPNVSFDQYWEVWDTLKEKYVDQPVSDVDLFYGSLKGLVGGLDDPYSAYFPPKQAKDFTESLSGEFDGIGAEIGLRDEQLTIVAPLPSSPAELSGLLPGDIILAIDEFETFGISLEEAVTKIRGKKGTEVVLTIFRKSEETSRDISILRDKINIPSVVFEMKDGDIAYAQISTFNNKTVREFDEAVKELLLKSPKGMILDLRRNPGGFLDASVIVASEWVEEGVIVRERFIGGEVREHLSTNKHRLVDMPTVVLVDEGTASGSEIVAGALQDYKAATIIGMQTFGKGSVQDFEFLKDGSALKLTIAKWFTPEDRGIDKEGVMPDIILEEMFEIPEGIELTDRENIRDLGMEKALEILSK